jgi:hypothetical protein
VWKPALLAAVLLAAGTSGAFLFPGDSSTARPPCKPKKLCPTTSTSTTTTTTTCPASTSTMPRPSIDITVLCDPPVEDVQGHGTAALRYGNDTWSTSLANDIHTIVISTSHYGEVAAWRAANPQMRVLLYTMPFEANDQFPLPNVPGATATTTLSLASVQAHDAANPGDLWQLKNGSGAILGDGTSVILDPAKVSLQDQLVTILRALKAEYPLIDGFLFDNINGALAQIENNGPAALYPYTSGENSMGWELAMEAGLHAISDEIRVADENYLLMNAGKAGNRLIDPAFEGGTAEFLERMAPYTSAFLLEWYVQSPVLSPSPAPADGDTTPYPSYYYAGSGPAHWTARWDGDFFYPQFVRNLGVDPYVGQTGSRTLAGGSLANDQRHMLFAKASFHLTWDGGEGGMYFVVSARGSNNPFDPRWTTDLGQPDEDPVLAPNVGSYGFMRKWTGGIVAVHAGSLTAPSQLFNLNGMYTPVEGGAAVSSVTLPPKTGFVGITP